MSFSQENCQSLHDKVVWAQRPIGESSQWWPALKFDGWSSLLSSCAASSHLKYSDRMDIRIRDIHSMLSNQNQGALFFLGCNQAMHEPKDAEFRQHMNMLYELVNGGLSRPSQFHSQQDFVDFHVAVEVATHIATRTHGLSGDTGKDTTADTAQRAESQWKEYIKTRSTDHLETVRDPPSSPNPSVAAISLAEDSTMASSVKQPASADHKQEQDSGPNHYPPLVGAPLGNVPWDEAVDRLESFGWSSCYPDDSGMRKFQADVREPLKSEMEMQQIAKEFYGWECLEDVSSLPLIQQLAVFFCWKYVNQIHRWRKTKRGNVTIYCTRRCKGKGTIDVDCFDARGFLNHCHREQLYPEPSHKLFYPSPIEILQGQESVPKHECHSTKVSQNFAFLRALTIELEPAGWTAAIAPPTTLYDERVCYVPPGGKYKNGLLGSDYFESEVDVLQYQKRIKNGHAKRRPTQAYAATDDDESTKFPMETEDDRTEYTQGTQGDCSTPDTKTQPQDPGKPRLTDDEEDDGATAKSDVKLCDLPWHNLWPELRNLGWKLECKNSRYRFYRPRNVFGTGAPGNVQGVDYFTNKGDVRAYLRQMDLEMEGKAPRTGSSQKDHSTKKNHSKKPDSKRDSKGDTKKSFPKDKPRPIATKKRKLETEIPKVEVEVSDNKAPWIQAPLPTNQLHRLCMKVGGMGFAGATYYLPGESRKNFTECFEQMSDYREYCCIRGKGQYHVEPSAPEADKATFDLWVRGAFVPGVDFHHARTRALSLEEVGEALPLFGYQDTDGCWTPPKSIRGGSSTTITPGLLKPEYPSLHELLLDLYRVPDLRGNVSSGRRISKLPEKLENLYMALRLFIAYYGIDGWTGGDLTGHDTSVPKKPPTKVARKTAPVVEDDRSDGQDVTMEKSPKDELDFDQDCQRQEKRSKKKKKKRLGNPHDIDVSAPEGYEYPWYTDTISYDGTLAAKIGVQWVNSVYVVPGIDKNVKTFTSVDHVFQHFSTYGGYDETNLSGDDLDTFRAIVVHGHVFKHIKEWRSIRKLTRNEGTLFLELYGIKKEGPVWRVPERMRRMRNIYLPGEPPILNESYPNLHSLLVDLNKIPNLEDTKVEEGKRTRNHDQLLSGRSMLALRLWMANAVLFPEELSGSESEGSSSMESSSDEDTPLKVPTTSTPLEKKNEKRTKTKAVAQTKQPVTQSSRSKTRLSLGTIQVDSNGSNDLPWAVDLPLYSTAQALGLEFLGGRFHAPIQNGQSVKVFDSTEDVYRHYSVYQDFNISLLNAEKREIFLRGLAYAHVTKSPPHWQRVRLLTLEEATFLLGTLGFKQKSGMWIVPERFQGRTDQYSLAGSYDSLETLCFELSRVWDLQNDEASGRSRRRNPTPLISNENIVLALKLWFGYMAVSVYKSKYSKVPFIDSAPSQVPAPEGKETEGNATREAEDNAMPERKSETMEVESEIPPEGGSSVVQMPTELTKAPEAMDIDCDDLESFREKARQDLRDSICTSAEAQKILTDIGCGPQCGKIKTPAGDSFQSWEGLCQFVLRTTIRDILDDDRGANTGVSREALEKLHRYLSYFNVPVNGNIPVYEVLEKLKGLGAGIKDLLVKVGVDLGDEDWDRIVNTVRFSGLRDHIESGFKLGASEVEVMTVLIWAAEHETPLRHFDVEELCSENHATEEEKDFSKETASSTPNKEPGTPENYHTPASELGAPPLDDVVSPTPWSQQDDNYSPNRTSMLDTFTQDYIMMTQDWPADD